jgi:hypothetical protein
MAIVTEDGRTLTPGDRAYNYYDRKWGYIHPDEIEPDGWFYFVHDDGTSALLNGERICSADYATARGW